MRNCIRFLLLFYTFVDLFGQFNYKGPANGQSIQFNKQNVADFQRTHDNLTQAFSPIHIEGKYKTGESNTLLSKNNYCNSLNVLNSSEAKNEGIFIEHKIKGFEDIGETYAPDPYIALGPEHMIQVVNYRFRICDRLGNEIKTIGIKHWHEALEDSSKIFDPKVLYDHFDKRWIMVWLQMDKVKNLSSILLSVSENENPLGEWIIYKMAGNVNGNTPATDFADYQGVGYDDKAIYITYNQIAWNFAYLKSKIRIIKKTEIYRNDHANIEYSDIWDFNFPGKNISAFGIRPTRFWSSADEYYLAVHSMESPSIEFAVFKIVNVLSEPELKAESFIVSEYSDAPNSIQPGDDAPELIAGGNYLRNEPVYRDGYLHLTHLIGGNPTAIRYLCFDMKNNSLHRDVTFGVEGYYSSHPALAVNNSNDVFIGYSSSSPEVFRGAYFNVIPFSTGIPTNTVLLQEGKATYDNWTYSNGTTRWGDYNGACTDPIDQSTVWLVTEFVEEEKKWGNVITSILYDEINMIEDLESSLSEKIELLDNYPNPFNPSTKIEYFIPTNAHVTLTVTNSLGERVSTLVDEQLAQGKYETEFYASDLGSGIYYYTLKILFGNKIESKTKKMILMK